MSPRPQINMRLDERTNGMLLWLMRHLNLNIAGVVRLAIVRLAQAEGWQDEA